MPNKIQLKKILGKRLFLFTHGKVLRVRMDRDPAYTLSTHHLPSFTNGSSYGLIYFYLGLPQQKCTYKDHAQSTETSAKSLAQCGLPALWPFHDMWSLSNACKVQALGSTWDLPRELQTRCYSCPCAQEITGHDRSNQNATRCTATPGKLLLNTMSTLKSTNGVLSKRLPLQTPMSESVWFCVCFMYFYNCSFWRLP